MLRLLYFVASYRPFGEVERLVRALRERDLSSEIVVHHDRFRSAPPEFEAQDRVRVLTSDRPVEWGGRSVVAMRLRVLRWCRARLEFEHVVFLSEQDYPIARPVEFRRWLEGHDADAYLPSAPVPHLPLQLQGTVCKHYGYRYFGVSLRRLFDGLPYPIDRKATTALRRLAIATDTSSSPIRLIPAPHDVSAQSLFGHRRLRPPPPALDPLWFGDAWGVLSRRAVEVILDRLTEEPELWRFYRSCFAAEESLFATIVGNTPGLRSARQGSHHIRWADGSPHPDVFTIEDLDELANSGRFFARKLVHDRSAALLDALDDRLAKG